MYQICNQHHVQTTVTSGQQRTLQKQSPLGTMPFGRVMGSAKNWAHNPKVAGSNPAPATKCKSRSGPVSDREPALSVGRIGPVVNDLSTLVPTSTAAQIVNMRRRAPCSSRITPGPIDVCETRRSHVGSQTRRGSHTRRSRTRRPGFSTSLSDGARRSRGDWSTWVTGPARLPATESIGSPGTGRTTGRFARSSTGGGSSSHRRDARRLSTDRSAS